MNNPSGKKVIIKSLDDYGNNFGYSDTPLCVYIEGSQNPYHPHFIHWCQLEGFEFDQDCSPEDFPIGEEYILKEHYVRAPEDEPINSPEDKNIWRPLGDIVDLTIVY